MRSKQILSIIAFITAFASSSAFALLFVDKSSTKYAIETILRQDLNYGQERLWRISGNDRLPAESQFKKYAETVEEYADDAGSLNHSHLPREFQIRWNEHMRAWRDYSNYLNTLKNSSAGLDENFYRKQKEHTADINLTYFDVLRIGSRHGVDVSEYINH